MDVVVTSNGHGLVQLSLNRPPQALKRDHQVEEEHCSPPRENRRSLSSNPAKAGPGPKPTTEPPPDEGMQAALTALVTAAQTAHRPPLPSSGQQALGQQAPGTRPAEAATGAQALTTSGGRRRPQPH